ncbi:MAG: phosphatase PAP2 family protein [Alphaproteobacteria bacterium]|nr:phosphatase PAP2 family protein [Alphaproteobacteria bacterium]
MKSGIKTILTKLTSKETLSNPQVILMLALFACFLFGLMFREVIDEIWIEKKLLPLDAYISNWMRQDQERHDQIIFIILTLLGSPKFLGIVTLLTSAYLFYRHRYWEGGVFAVGVALSSLGVYIVKLLTHRERPVPDFPSIVEHSAAFPSGHAAMSLFVYGFCAYLISRQVHNRKHAVLVTIAGIGLAGMIGVSRLYLEMHWLSDVLGGFTLASAFLCLGIGILEAQRVHLNH